MEWNRTESNGIEWDGTERKLTFADFGFAMVRARSYSCLSSDRARATDVRYAHIADLRSRVAPEDQKKDRVSSLSP